MELGFVDASGCPVSRSVKPAADTPAAGYRHSKIGEPSLGDINRMEAWHQSQADTAAHVARVGADVLPVRGRPVL